MATAAELYAAAAALEDVQGGTPELPQSGTLAEDVQLNRLNEFQRILVQFLGSGEKDLLVGYPDLADRLAAIAAGGGGGSEPHTHPVEQLGTGTPDATTFLRGDGVWASIGGDIGPGTVVRYVRVDGDDTNDGLTWATAKQHVMGPNGALADLEEVIAEWPEGSGNFNSWRPGVIYFGVGNFTESEPIPAYPWLSLKGTAVGYRRTSLGVGDNVNNWLLQLPSTFTEFPHFFEVSDMTLDGRSAVNPTGPGLLDTRNGGFNWICRNVFFRDTMGVGVKIDNFGANFLFDNCVWDLCRTNAMLWNVNNDACHIEVRHCQVDNCGVSPFKIVQLAGAGSHNSIAFTGITKGESVSGTGDPTWHQYFIDVTPRTEGVGDRLHVMVDRLVVSRNANPNQPDTYAIYERAKPASNPGGTSGIRLDARNITAIEYAKATKSVFQGYESVGKEDWNVQWSGGWSKHGDYYGVTGGLQPAFTIDGVPRVYATSDPPTTGTFPNGMEWIRTGSGNANSGKLWRRINDAWVEK